MARIRSGILGNIRGKVSGVVGGQWKDKNYLREYVKPANPNTAAQQAQRALMSNCVAFAKSLVGPVFNAYTDKFQKSMSGFNRFIKTNIAFFVADPTYSNIIMTAGVLFPLQDVSAVYTAVSGVCQITWDEAIGNNGSLTDKVFAAVYDSNTGLWYFPAAEEDRDTETTAIQLPETLTPADIECWIWAIQYSGAIVSKISNSTYDNGVA